MEEECLLPPLAENKAIHVQARRMWDKAQGESSSIFALKMQTAMPGLQAKAITSLCLLKLVTTWRKRRKVLPRLCPHRLIEAAWLPICQ